MDTFSSFPSSPEIDCCGKVVRLRIWHGIPPIAVYEAPPGKHCSLALSDSSCCLSPRSRSRPHARGSRELVHHHRLCRIVHDQEPWCGCRSWDYQCPRKPLPWAPWKGVYHPRYVLHFFFLLSKEKYCSLVFFSWITFRCILCRCLMWYHDKWP